MRWQPSFGTAPSTSSWARSPLSPASATTTSATCSTTPVRAISQILGPDCCVLTPLASEDLLTKARCNDDQPGYELWGNVLTVYPTPKEACTFMVHAYRRPNDELFTDTLEPQEGEDKFGEPLPPIPVRRWNFIDLPEEFHAAYENCLIGLALCESGDASAGTKWLELAGAAFDTQKEVKDEGQTAPTSKVLKMDNWCRKRNPCCGTCGEEYGVIGGGCECAA